MSSTTSSAFERISAALDRLAELEPEQWEGAVAQLLSDDEERARALRLAREELLDDSQRLSPEEAASAGKAFPQLVADVSSSSHGEELPTSIGEFRILERLGSGGMGEVFLADRTRDQFTQRVALKRVRVDGLGSRATRARARFLTERELLAGLEHPNIARFIDGGEEEEGTLYYAMEFVDGKPITAMCDELQLSLRQRVEVFCSACEAVAAAHRHMVLHRDLKPANILMTREGTVKLVDFGIAKLVRGEPTGAATATHAFTPEYAAPEQQLGMTTSTATDIYGLGLVLYELLLGVGAHRATTSPGSSLESRLERGATPPRAAWSAATADVGEAELQRIALARGSSLAQIERDFQGDLANIVAQALRTEPTERYASAEALRSDLENYLAQRPVQATRGSLSYRVRKLVQRHRVAAALLAAAMVFVAIGILGTLTQGQRASRERERAQQAEAEAEAVNRFLLEDLIGSFSPEVAQARELSLGDLTDLAAARLAESTDQTLPMRRALHQRLAELYLEQGDAAGAGEQLEAASQLAARSASEGSSRQALLETRLALLRDDYRHAEEILAALPRDDRSEARDEALLLAAEVARRSGSWTAAEQDLRRFLRDLEKRDPPSRRLELRAKQQLYEALAEQRRIAEALSLASDVFVEQTTLFGPRHPTVIATGCGLTRLYLREERDREGLANARQQLDVARTVLGEDHPLTLRCANLLGWALTENGAYEDALAAYAEIERQAARRQGLGSRRMLAAVMNQGVVYARQDRPADALPYYRRAVEGYVAHYGAQSPESVRALRNLERALRQLGREQEANQVIEQLLAVGHQRALEEPIDATLLADFALNLATRFPEQYRDVEAARRYAELAHEVSGGRRFLTLLVLARIARLQGDLAAALAALEQAAPLPSAIVTYSFEVTVVDVGVESGEAQRAETILRSVLQRRLEQRPEDPIVAISYQRLSELYQRTGNLPAALEEARSAAKHLSTCCDPNHRFAGLAALQLSRVLTDLLRFDEAEQSLQRAEAIFAANSLADERDHRATRAARELLAERRAALPQP